MSSTRLRVLCLALAAATALTLAGCTQSGDDFAAGLAERVVIGIGDDITPPRPTPLEADYLAAWAIRDPRLPRDVAQTDYTVEALAWEGNSGDEEGARITLRITVHVHAQSGGLFQGLDHAEGRATRCWELTVFGLHDYDSLKKAEIECPSGAAPAVPDPAPLPAMPDDVDARLLAALEGATASDIDQRVGDAFPEEYYTIESRALNDELAVALGVPSAMSCELGIIHADGTIEVGAGGDPDSLQAGEQGCSPDLYFYPVITH